MDEKKLVGYFIVSLSAALLLLFSFSMTGFAINGQRLIVSLDIESAQQKITPGENLLLEVVIREPGGSMEETSFIDLEYSIKDSKGNIISSKKESGAIAVKQSEVTGLLIPTDTKPGVYTASVDVIYKEEIYSGTKTFEVIKQNREFNFLYTVIIIMGGIILFLLFGGRLKRNEGEKRGAEFGGWLEAFKKNIRKSNYYGNSAQQLDVRKQPKTKNQEIMYKLAVMSKKETEEPSYEPDIRYQNENEEGQAEKQEVELIEEVVEETEKRNKKRKTVEEEIEESGKLQGKKKR